MDVLRNLLLVGAGGAAGSCLRYLVSIIVVRSGGSFPWATLAVNLAGSVALAWLFRNGATAVSDPTRLLIGMGLLGGFTTYSSFNYEVVDMIRHGHAGQAAAYLLVTVVVALGAALYIVEQPS